MLGIEDDVWHNMSENLSNEFVLEKKNQSCIHIQTNQLYSGTISICDWMNPWLIPKMVEIKSTTFILVTWWIYPLVWNLIILVVLGSFEKEMAVLVSFFCFFFVLK